jgi:hypothetical protein
MTYCCSMMLCLQAECIFDKRGKTHDVLVKAVIYMDDFTAYRVKQTSHLGSDRTTYSISCGCSPATML